MSMFQALRPFAREMLDRTGVVIQFGSFIYCFGTYVMDVTTVSCQVCASRAVRQQSEDRQGRIVAVSVCIYYLLRN